jgi:hypothetical protein
VIVEGLRIKLVHLVNGKIFVALSLISLKLDNIRGSVMAGTPGSLAASYKMSDAASARRLRGMMHCST